jgi:hypothetical protein
MKSSGAMIRVKMELVAIVSQTGLSPSSGFYVTIEAAAHIPCLRRSAAPCCGLSLLAEYGQSKNKSYAVFSWEEKK